MALDDDDGGDGCTPHLAVNVRGAGMPVGLLSDRQRRLVSLAPSWDRLARGELGLLVVDDIDLAGVLPDGPLVSGGCLVASAILDVSDRG